MSRFLLTGVVVAGLFAGTASGQITVSLSSPDDLMNLKIGDTATVQVNVSGISPTYRLDTLSTIVKFKPGVFTLPNISTGWIVPNPTHHAWDYLETAKDGHAEASFQTMGTEPQHHISSDGPFYSFEITAAAKGGWAFALEIMGLDATAFNPDHPYLPTGLSVTAGSPLSFMITPEPSSLITAATLLASLALGWAWRRWKRTSWSQG